MRSSPQNRCPGKRVRLPPSSRFSRLRAGWSLGSGRRLASVGSASRRRSRRRRRGRRRGQRGAAGVDGETGVDGGGLGPARRWCRCGGLGQASSTLVGALSPGRLNHWPWASNTSLVRVSTMTLVHCTSRARWGAPWSGGSAVRISAERRAAKTRPSAVSSRSACPSMTALINAPASDGVASRASRNVRGPWSCSSSRTGEDRRSLGAAWGSASSEPVGRWRDPDLGLGEVDTDGVVRPRATMIESWRPNEGVAVRLRAGASDRKISSTMEGVSCREAGEDLDVVMVGLLGCVARVNVG
jgi:hypothetical protein